MFDITNEQFFYLKFFLLQIVKDFFNWKKGESGDHTQNKFTFFFELIEKKTIL